MQFVCQKFFKHKTCLEAGHQSSVFIELLHENSSLEINFFKLLKHLKEITGDILMRILQETKREPGKFFDEIYSEFRTKILTIFL